MKFGKTYYAAETDAEGNVITEGILAEDGSFVVDFANGNSAEITEGEGTQVITFANTLVTIPSSYYTDGELLITKKLVGSDGHAKQSDGVFYAGIFADENFTVLADCVSSNIVKLSLAGESSVSESVKVTFVKGKSVTLYVTEVDANGNPVADAEDFHYDVTVDNPKIIIDETNNFGDVVITNCEDEGWGSEEGGGDDDSSKKDETKETSAETTTSDTVKTGDYTVTSVYVIALLAAAAVMAVLGMLRRRNYR